eukprot:sb/3478403/
MNRMSHREGFLPFLSKPNREQYLVSADIVSDYTANEVNRIVSSIAYQLILVIGSFDGVIGSCCTLIVTCSWSDGYNRLGGSVHSVPTHYRFSLRTVVRALA